MKKLLVIILSLFLVSSIAIICCVKIFYIDPLSIFKPKLTIDNIKFNKDKNHNGIDDLDDIVIGARQEVTNKTKYTDGYFEGGYPPSNEGVCTDVIWRALKNAGYDLKSDIDADIKKNPSDYSSSIKTPDPNIDFRRVKNLQVFFKKYAENFTTEVIPYDKANLTQWQRGDIVILQNSEHVGIISDKRGRDGVPYVIHNTSPSAKESNSLLNWYKNNRIIGHYRFPKN